MAEQAAAEGLLPVVSFLKIPEQGDPYLEGHRCRQCSAVFLGERNVCSNCATRDQIEPIKLSNELPPSVVLKTPPSDAKKTVFGCVGCQCAAW